MVSCEALTDNSSVFDGIQFYKIEGNQTTSFNMTFTKTQITQTFFNYSVTFQLTIFNYLLYSPGYYYTCCTTLKNKKTSNCVQVYLSNVGQPPITGLTTTLRTNTNDNSNYIKSNYFLKFSHIFCFSDLPFHKILKFFIFN